MAGDGAPSRMRRSQFGPSSSCPVVKVQRARRAHVEFNGWAGDSRTTQWDSMAPRISAVAGAFCRQAAPSAADAPEDTAYRRALSRIREADELVRVADRGHAAADVEAFTPRPASATRNPSTASGVAGIEPGKPCLRHHSL